MRARGGPHYRRLEPVKFVQFLKVTHRSASLPRIFESEHADIHHTGASWLKAERKMPTCFLSRNGNQEYFLMDRDMIYGPRIQVFYWEGKSRVQR